MTAFLSLPAVAVGERKRSIEESAAGGLLVSDAAHLTAAGFRWHHVAAETQTSYDLAEQAVGELARHAPGVLDSVDTIVHATCLPENAALAGRSRFEETRDVRHLMDYTASRLQARFGLERAKVIGIGQQACTGLLGAIRIARALAVAEPSANATALCLTADRFPPQARYEQAYNPISDGAAACIVTAAAPQACPCLRIVAAHHLTNGALACASDDETVGSYFNWTHRLVTELLDGAGLELGTIDWVVPQNTNPAAWKILSRLLRVEPDRVWFPTLPDVAHMISGDNIANLAALLQSGELRRGDRVLLVMAGYGMNWQATLLEAM